MANKTIDVFKELGDIIIRPPRLKYQGQYKECLDISRDNFKYFADNQSGKTKFLNVIQGDDAETYEYWYHQVKDYPITVKIFSNQAEKIKKNYVRYLKNNFNSYFKILNQNTKIMFSKSGNPYS